jgi:hypothetical protein
VRASNTNTVLESALARARLATKMKIRKKITFRGCLTVYAIILLCIVLFLIFGPGVLLHFVRRAAGMSPAARAEMDRFFEEPVRIPKEWQVVEPFPQEVLDASNRLAQRWTAIEQSKGYWEWVNFYDRLKRGDTLTDEDWAAISRILRQQQAFRQQLSALVELPGYEFEAFPGLESRYRIIDFLLVNVAVKLLCLESYDLAHQDKWDQAFEPCLICLRMIRRHPASDTVTHLAAIGTEEMVSKCVCCLAVECEDAQVLRSLLTDMNRLHPDINLNVLREALLVSAVAELRHFARKGEAVDFDSVRPAAYFRRQVLFIEAGKTGEGPLPDGLSRRQIATWLFRNDLPFSRVAADYLYGLSVSNYFEMRTRELTAESYYDLARLIIAARIHQLETAEEAPSVDDIVPTLLPEKLIDPFSDETYGWDSEQHCFYSVGPDQTDNACAVVYDPTNGTLSTGDIVIPR